VSKNLSNFLVDLASDPDRMNAFRADPARVLNESSLSGREKMAVMTGSGKEIRGALGVRALAAEIPVGVTKRKPKTKAKPKPKPKSKSRKSSKKK